MSIFPSPRAAGSRRSMTERRPIIGIPIPVEADARWRSWGEPALLLMPGYSNHVREAGGIPIMLPVAGDAAEAEDVALFLDGLILPGGADIDPALFGDNPHPASGPFDPARDQWESALLRAAMAREVPVFGICRGMQLVNVVRGGTLIQHLPDVVGSDVHNPTVGSFAVHRIATAPGSDLARAVGKEAVVSTYHHQAVDRIGSGLIAAAWAGDGVIEGLEDKDRGVLAVQWHPEAGTANEVFQHFIAMCRDRTVTAHALAREPL